MAATFERPSVSTELARTMIEAAEKKAAEMGHPFDLWFWRRDVRTWA